MEITCWGYKKSLPVAYNWSNHTPLKGHIPPGKGYGVPQHQSRSTPPQTSNFSVANANWLNFPMRVLWLNFEKRIAALFPAERWCKKHAGAFLDMWCERLGLFWQLMPRLSSCTCAVPVQNTDRWIVLNAPKSRKFIFNFRKSDPLQK